MKQHHHSSLRFRLPSQWGQGKVGGSRGGREGGRASMTIRASLASLCPARPATHRRLAVRRDLAPPPFVAVDIARGYRPGLSWRLLPLSLVSGFLRKGGALTRELPKYQDRLSCIYIAPPHDALACHVEGRRDTAVVVDADIWLVHQNGRELVL